MWLATEDLVRAKHDPGALPFFIYNAYRSVVTERFVEEMEDFLRFAALHGSWFFLPEFGTYNHLTECPRGLMPGAGIPSGGAAPDHALECLVVAEANVDPHVFAAEGALVQEQILTGEWIPLGSCSTPGCANLRVPARSHCVVHGEDGERA